MEYDDDTVQRVWEKCQTMENMKASKQQKCLKNLLCNLVSSRP